MISSHLMGGLGNQLFQIFTTIAYGITNKVKFIFPYSAVLNDATTTRYTYWDSFLASLKIFTTFNNNNMELNNFSLFRENGFNYNNLPIFYNHTMLYGYWQSYKYFDDMKDKIFQMIRLQQFKDSVKNEYSKYFYENTDLISMHFRLGDYKTRLSSYFTI